MKVFLHMLEHWLGWNGGRVVTRLDEQGRVWIGFQCSTCGKISSRHMGGAHD